MLNRVIRKPFKPLKGIFKQLRCQQSSVANNNEFDNSDATSSSSSSFILSDDKIQLAHDEKVLLQNVYDNLKEHGSATKDELDLILDTRSRIEDFFTLVVCGEFNSGKSTLINALFGNRHLKEGLLPTTNKINIIRSKSIGNDNVWRRPDNFLIDDVEELNVNLAERMEWLQHVAIVDTPGTNAIIKRHEELTQRIVPRADLILFVTSAERPMSDSESAFLEKIKSWGKKVIMVVNKIDILDGIDDKKSVLDYVSQNTAKILELSGVDTIPVFGLSGRQALEARLWAGPEGIVEESTTDSSPKKRNEAKRLWSASEMSEFEISLKKILSKDSLIKSKLVNPLLTADRVLIEVNKRLNKRNEQLLNDIRVLEMVDDNMIMFKSDCQRDTKHFRQRINDIVERLRVSYDTFLSDNITLTKPGLLMDPELFQKELSKHVDSDLAQPIDKCVDEMVTVISDRATLQARAVLEYLGTRPKRYEGAILGNISDETFNEGRTELLSNVRNDLLSILKSDAGNNLQNHTNVGKEMGKAAQTSLQMAAGAGLASVGTLGSLMAAHCLDVTGVMLASSMAMAGLFMVPARRKLARDAMSNSFDSLKHDIDEAVGSQVDLQIEATSVRIMDSIAPYTRFVRIETDKLKKADEVMKLSQTEIDEMLQKIQKKE